MDKFFLVILVFLFSISGFAEIKRNYYIQTPYGRVKLNTANDIKKQKEDEYKDKYGRSDNSVGVEFKTKAIREKKDDKEILKAFVRGCGYIELKALTDSEKEQKTLDEIKNGDAIIVKMEKGKKCTVSYWEKIFD